MKIRKYAHAHVVCFGNLPGVDLEYAGEPSGTQPPTPNETFFHTHTNLSRVQFTYACLCLCVYVICMYVNVDKMDVDGKGMMARKTGIGTNIGVRAGRAFRALFRFFRMRESNRN